MNDITSNGANFKLKKFRKCKIFYKIQIIQYINKIRIDKIYAHYIK